MLRSLRLSIDSFILGRKRTWGEPELIKGTSCLRSFGQGVVIQGSGRDRSERQVMQYGFQPYEERATLWKRNIVSGNGKDGRLRIGFGRRGRSATPPLIALFIEPLSFYTQVE